MRSGAIQKYRVAFVFEPNEAEAGRLASHPCIIDLPKVAEEIPEVTRLRLGRKVADKNLRVQNTIQMTRRESSNRRVRKLGRTVRAQYETDCTWGPLLFLNPPARTSRHFRTYSQAQHNKPRSLCMRF